MRKQLKKLQLARIQTNLVYPIAKDVITLDNYYKNSKYLLISNA